MQINNEKQNLIKKIVNIAKKVYISSHLHKTANPTVIDGDGRGLEPFNWKKNIPIFSYAVIYAPQNMGNYWRVGFSMLAMYSL